MSEYAKELDKFEKEFRGKHKLVNTIYFLLKELEAVKEENRRLKIALAKILMENPNIKPKELEGIDLSTVQEELKVKYWVEIDRRMESVRSAVLKSVITLYSIYRRPLTAEEIISYTIDRYAKVFGRKKAEILSIKWDFRRRLYELAEQGKIIRVGRNLFLPRNTKEKVGLEKYFK